MPVFPHLSGREAPEQSNVKSFHKEFNQPTTPPPQVLRLRSHIDQVHARAREGDSHLPGGLRLHGTRHDVPSTLGGNIRLMQTPSNHALQSSIFILIFLLMIL